MEMAVGKKSLMTLEVKSWFTTRVASGPMGIVSKVPHFSRCDHGK